MSEYIFVTNIFKYLHSRSLQIPFYLVRVENKCNHHSFIQIICLNANSEFLHLPLRLPNKRKSCQKKEKGENVPILV